MRYIDLHCDTLTVCADKGLSLFNCNLQTDFNKLLKSGCAAQCFAVFTEGENAAADFERYIAFYKSQISESDICRPVINYGDFALAESEGKLGCILTVENLGFIGGDLGRIDRLKDEGVKMASLVWNHENLLARPNLIFKDGLPVFEKRDNRGLTNLGREAVERLDKNKIIVDISHLSDGGAEEILNMRKIPVVASHSNACGVCNVSRNLTDSLIKKIADCGGVIGVNFCHDFLGGETLESVYSHIIYIMNRGGEDCVALGSDFDGIPVNDGLESCEKMPNLLDFLEKRGISHKILQKIAYKNFLRVFEE